jgi:hypothetical protein
MLRDNHPLIKIEDEDKGKTAKTATAMDSSIMESDDGLRRRGRGVQGLESGASFANPFVDEPGQVIFDQAKKQEAQTTATTTVEPESRESTATIQADHEPYQSPINATTENPFISTLAQNPTASIHSLASLEALIPISASEHSEHELQPPEQEQEQDQASQSFYSFASSSSLSASSDLQQSNTHIFSNYGEGAEVMSTGTLTPIEDGFSTAASMVDSHADDIAVLSMTHDDLDARSEAFSETGFTEAGFSEAGFSELGEGRLGVHTPGSWTDVESESGSEYGGPHGTNPWSSTVHYQ